MKKKAHRSLRRHNVHASYFCLEAYVNPHEDPPPPKYFKGPGTREIIHAGSNASRLLIGKHTESTIWRVKRGADMSGIREIVELEFASSINRFIITNYNCFTNNCCRRWVVDFSMLVGEWHMVTDSHTGVTAIVILDIAVPQGNTSATLCGFRTTPDAKKRSSFFWGA